MADIQANQVQIHNNMWSRFKKFFTKPLPQALLWSMGVGIISSVIVWLISSKDLMYVVDADMANAFLGTVAQVTAGIVAIVFTVSTLAVTMVSDRYSSQLTEKFLYDPLTITTFLFLLLCGTVAVVSIGVSYPMFQWGFLVMVFSFIFCITMVLFYLIHTVSFMKPEGLATDLLEEGSQAFRDQDYEKLERVITSLGDIVLKAFDRGEDAVAKLYLQSLAQLQEYWLENGQPVEGRDVSFASIGFGTKSPIFNQYSRLLKAFSARGDDDLSETIEGLASANIISLVEKNASADTLKGLISQYNNLANIVIKNKNPVRYRFLYSYRNIIGHGNHDRIINDQLLSISLRGFVEANRTLISASDIELWQETLEFFCSGFESPDGLVQSFHHSLSNLRTVLSNEHLEWYRKWSSTPRKTINIYSSKYIHQLVSSYVANLEQKLPTNEKTELWIKFLNYYNNQVYITRRLIYSFFLVGFESFKLKNDDYLEQLWKAQFSNPSLDRIPSDITFNIILIYDYHTFFVHSRGEEELFLQYRFLYLAYALHISKQLEWGIEKPVFSDEGLKQRDDLHILFIDELKYFHAMLQNLPYILKELLEAYQSLNNISERFDNIFDGKTSDALQKAYEWLNNLPFLDKWSEAADNLILSLPIDPVKQDQIKQSVENGYLKSTKLNSLTVVISESSRQDESEEIFVPESQEVSIREHINRVDLTLLGSDRSYEHLGFQISSREESLLSTTILSNENIEHLSTQQLSFSLIEDAVNNIQISDTTPTILLLNLQVYHDLWDGDPAFRSKITNDSDGNRMLKVNAEVELLILDDLGIDVNKIIVFSPNLSEWQELSLLTIDIEPCPDNPLKLHVDAKKAVSCKVVQPSAGLIIDVV